MPSKKVELRGWGELPVAIGKERMLWWRIEGEGQHMRGKAEQWLGAERQCCNSSLGQVSSPYLMEAVAESK